MKEGSSESSILSALFIITVVTDFSIATDCSAFEIRKTVADVHTVQPCTYFPDLENHKLHSV